MTANRTIRNELKDRGRWVAGVIVIPREHDLRTESIKNCMGSAGARST
jgi:hypothetical protein